jgi:hypothetical protein
MTWARGVGQIGIATVRTEQAPILLRRRVKRSDYELRQGRRLAGSAGMPGGEHRGCPLQHEPPNADSIPSRTRCDAPDGSWRFPATCLHPNPGMGIDCALAGVGSCAAGAHMVIGVRVRAHSREFIQRACRMHCDALEMHFPLKAQQAKIPASPPTVPEKGGQLVGEEGFSKHEGRDG